jgi:hypothetical protein
MDKKERNMATNEKQKKEGRGMVTKKNLTLLIFCLMTLAIAAPLKAAEQSPEELAKAAQNPIANMISLPFQNNTNFNVGPTNSTQNVLNIQPVLPVRLNSDWNVITRTIMPLISQPDFGTGEGNQFGLGDIQFSAFFSPAKAGEFMWAVGPIVQLPTHTDDRLGSRQWGLGPTAVGLRIDGPWLYGALVNNVWSLGGDDEGPNQKYNNFLTQLFVNYNFGKTGTYLVTSPIITANWRTGDWVVPVGGGVGQVFKIFGKQPVNMSLQAYYNVVNPDEIGPEWQTRLQMVFLFPK